MNRELLFQTFLQNHSLNQLLEAVSAAFLCPVMVTDNGFHIVSASSAVGEENPEYRRAVSHSALPLAVCAMIGDRMLRTGDSRVQIDTGACRYLAAELRSGEVALGYILYVLSSDVQAPCEKDCLYAEALVAKQFYCERHSGSVPTDTAEEVLTDLLDGAFPDERLFELKAAGTFLAHFHPERFALLDLSEEPADPARQGRLQKSFSESFHASLPFFYHRSMIVFLHKDHDIRLLKRLIEEYRLCAAVSGKMQGLYEMRRQLPLVRDTLTLLRQKKKAPFLAESEDYALLMVLRKMIRETGYMEERVAALYRSDVQNDGQLCLTLYTYLICHHSLQKTGERLFTHRNTVQYRLRRIREEMGVEVDDPEDFTGLLLSLAAALCRLGRADLFVSPEERAIFADAAETNPGDPCVAAG